MTYLRHYAPHAGHACLSQPKFGLRSSLKSLYGRINWMLRSLRKELGGRRMRRAACLPALMLTSCRLTTIADVQALPEQSRRRATPEDVNFQSEPRVADGRRPRFWQHSGGTAHALSRGVLHRIRAGPHDSRARLPLSVLAAAIACDGSAMSAGTYQSDIVLESAEGAQRLPLVR